MSREESASLELLNNKRLTKLKLCFMLDLGGQILKRRKTNFLDDFNSWFSLVCILKEIKDFHII